MTIRRILVALAMTGALLAAGAVPAFAAGPPVPPGCTFDQATGVVTCVTTTTASTTAGPFTTSGFVAASNTFGGFTGAQICLVGQGVSNAVSLDMADVSLTETVTITTTTEQHGRNGKVFNTSTSTTPVSLDSVQIGPWAFELSVGSIKRRAIRRDSSRTRNDRDAS